MTNAGEDSRFDATDTIEVYEKGKTWECECGQGFGTEKEVRAVHCPTCGNTLVDEEAELRKEQEVDRPEKNQMALDQFA